MSIGWGIRGNFGHEYGAAFAGCLAALTVSLVSGREDWRGRVLYFGFFGALGWGFGGSMSYMQVIAYTQSGHWPSQWYGYSCLFLIGFLWAALGSIGTALPAVADKETLVGLFRPIVFVFAAWFIQDLVEDPLSNFLQSQIQFDHTWSRHKSPLYWFDADYFAAFFALAGLGIFDLTDRKEKNTFWLPVFILGGALLGFGTQQLLQTSGLDKSLASLLTYKLGDVTYMQAGSNMPAFDPDNFLNNWPQWFGDYPQHIGWVAGIVAGITAYFIRYGKFRSGASLLVCMASGWILSFLLFPVLGSLFFTNIGGLRMTPPRGDDWAGILGVFIGAVVWLKRYRFDAVLYAGLVGGTIGGLGFSGIQWIKLWLTSWGNPQVLLGKGMDGASPLFQQTVLAWADWQQQNWHSFLEQSYGFVNGIAIAVAIGLLRQQQILPGRSTLPGVKLYRESTAKAIAVFFILLAIPYVNLFKNVKEWSDRLGPENWQVITRMPDGSEQAVAAHWDVPYIGRFPGVDFLSFTAETWYRVTWVLLVILFVKVIRRHREEPLSFLPASWLGRGQLVFLMLLWLMIMGNFERALVGWGSSRLLTEWVITVNAMLATYFILTVPREKQDTFAVTAPIGRVALKRAFFTLILVFLISPPVLFVTNRMIYHYPEYAKLDKAHIHMRFGPDADWRAKPILKNEEHK
ncbi:hypothetical protein [Dyadobacter helix]|uniref:hypothetical protein n=1 Tax=Dyadobacter helix TaxID=2822344 RepID=UPI001E33E846|nr:hypothetical protein [Dyadobacter sp. CECT 9275]